MTSHRRPRGIIAAVSFALLGAGGAVVAPVGAATGLPVELGVSSPPAGRSFHAAAGDATADVHIAVSFFRYCVDEVCTLDQVGYVRAGSSGPTLPPAADNPRGIVDVRPGDRVTWTYSDPLCDFHDGNGGGPSPIFCPGHNIIFEDGSLTSPLLRARTTPADTFSWTVPDTAAPGTKIPYYCEPYPGLAHYLVGHTGILRIV